MNTTKTLVTHVSPDLDAVSSTWLVKKYLPGWEEPILMYVPAGKTLSDMDPDSDPNIIHTDTGLGKYDHHQLNDPQKQYSATQRVFADLVSKNLIPDKDLDAVKSMVKIVTNIDHFGELYFHEPLNDLYDFGLHQIMDGLKHHRMKDEDRSHFAFLALDSILHVLRLKHLAIQDIEKGLVFQTKWGKALAIESSNEETIRVALMKGFCLVVRKNVETGTARIKTLPIPQIDLTPVYEVIHAKEPQATWFLHISKNMLLNGSSKSPDSVNTKLTLPQLVEIVKNVA